MSWPELSWFELVTVGLNRGELGSVHLTFKLIQFSLVGLIFILNQIGHKRAKISHSDIRKKADLWMDDEFAINASRYVAMCFNNGGTISC